MSKETTKGWRVVEDEEIQEVVGLLVEFSESKKIHPKVLAAAMEFIANKIKAHLRIETKDIHEESKTIH